MISDENACKQPEVFRNQNSQTFTLFLNLPIELRAVIWQATLNPRTIEIRYHHSSVAGWTSPTKHPQALDVCHESRATILPLYPLCFGGSHHPPQIRINFAIDTVYLSGAARSFVPHFIGAMNSFEANQLRSLAIHERHLFYDIRRALRSLRGLQELLIVCIVGRICERSKNGRQLSVRIFDKIQQDNSLIEKLDLGYFQHLEVWQIPICRSVYGYAVEA
jgi:hypothetical protein